MLTKKLQETYTKHYELKFIGLDSDKTIAQRENLVLINGNLSKFKRKKIYLFCV